MNKMRFTLALLALAYSGDGFGWGVPRLSDLASKASGSLPAVVHHTFPMGKDGGSTDERDDSEVAGGMFSTLKNAIPRGKGMMSHLPLPDIEGLTGTKGALLHRLTNPFRSFQEQFSTLSFLMHKVKGFLHLG